jgi:hypothetical protein
MRKGVFVLLSTGLLAAAVALPCAGARANVHDRGDERDLSCDGSWDGNGRASHCEIRETTIKDFGGRLDVEPGLNGGVSVRGWDRNETLVRARVQTSDDTDAAAADLAGRIRIDTAGGRVRVDGPAMNDRSSWSVTFQIFVPVRSDVTVTTTNGGVSLSHLSGDISFEALNGGVALRDLGGNVHGHTTNGGLAVMLSGDRWDGEALDVATINGGVMVEVPDNYSARLETGTVHGHLVVDLPVTVEGKITTRLSTTIGAGGPLVRVMTTNGGVVIRKQQ